MRNLATALAALPLWAHAAPDAVSVSWEVASSGSLRSRLADRPADLVLLVVGEHEGELAPCGCAGRPLGGIARAVGYRDAVARSGTPTLLVHAGHWADETIDISGGFRGDAEIGNRAMAQALSPFDAVNLGYRDVVWWERNGLPQAMSASVQGDAPVARWITRQIDGVQVAVVGVTAVGMSFLPPASTLMDPVVATRAAVAEVGADVVIVVGLGLGPAAADVAQVEGVDLLIDADEHTERWPPERLGGAIWVRTVDAGQALTEVRVALSDGGLAQVAVRSVDLDDAIRGPRELERLAARTAAEREAWQRTWLAIP